MLSAWETLPPLTASVPRDKSSLFDQDPVAYERELCSKIERERLDREAWAKGHAWLQEDERRREEWAIDVDHAEAEAARSTPAVDTCEAAAGGHVTQVCGPYSTC